MLRFIDSFDHYTLADITQKWNTLNNTDNVTVTAGAGRNGGAALRITNGVTARYLAKIFGAQGTWIIGFAFRPGVILNGAYVLAELLDVGSSQCDLRMNADYTLSVTRGGVALTDGTSVAALSSGVYSHIEWRVTIANSIGPASCRVRLNGVTALTVATGQDTQATGNSTANQVRIGPSNLNFECRFNWDFDDVYIADGTGSLNNDFLGDVAIQVLYPSGAGTQSGWTPVGAATNAQNVDEAVPNGDTDYNSAATAALVDLYAMQDLPGTPAAIKAVQWVANVRKDDASTYILNRVVRSGGVDYQGTTDDSPNNTYAYFTEVLETDPATGAAWVKAGIDAMQAGIKLVSIT